ncbi:MAG: 3-dehydroquinate synthase [Chthoniobacterales bacterium]
MASLISVEVPLAANGYEVWIGDGLLGRCGERVRGVLSGKNVALVTDSNVGPIYATSVANSLEGAGFAVTPITVAAGEASKRFECVEEICDAMIEAGLDRNAGLVALGGGVVGDLAGFAAAIYFRGIPFVQMPTTVMAQVDSSVGGKTGINASGGKNLIGSFHQPRAVLADPGALQSLPVREFREGFAEVIKHAVIADADMLDKLDPDRRDGLEELIARNVRIKAGVVVADERERSGQRALLNFGHTVGHAIEQAAGYGRFLHGEAIGIGIHAALRLSVEKAGLSEAECERVVSKLETFGLPTRVPEDLSVEAILRAMSHDKKFAEGAVRFVLCERLGSAFVSDAVGVPDVERVVGELRGSAA